MLVKQRLLQASTRSVQTLRLLARGMGETHLVFVPSDWEGRADFPTSCLSIQMATRVALIRRE
eukprot:5562329-Pleurochrysis_carterae.AAC.1